jgi:hypothetical protein
VVSASDWARPDPADSADMPSADQPAILPNCRLENLLNGIISLAAPGSILSKTRLTLDASCLKQA